MARSSHGLLRQATCAGTRLAAGRIEKTLACSPLVQTSSRTSSSLFGGVGSLIGLMAGAEQERPGQERRRQPNTREEAPALETDGVGHDADREGRHGDAQPRGGGIGGWNARESLQRRRRCVEMLIPSHVVFLSVLSSDLMLDQGGHGTRKGLEARADPRRLRLSNPRAKERPCAAG